jgi:hypothetical protein
MLTPSLSACFVSFEYKRAGQALTPSNGLSGRFWYLLA